MAVHGANVLSIATIPEANCLISACAGEYSAIMMNGNSPDPASVSWKHFRTPSCFHIPQAHSTIITATDDCLSCWKKSERTNTVVVPTKYREAFTCLDIPQTDRLI